MGFPTTYRTYRLVNTGVLNHQPYFFKKLVLGFQSWVFQYLSILQVLGFFNHAVHLGLFQDLFYMYNKISQENYRQNPCTNKCVL